LPKNRPIPQAADFGAAGYDLFTTRGRRRPNAEEPFHDRLHRPNKKGRAIIGAAILVYSVAISRDAVAHPENPSSGGAKIVGRRFARTAICHDFVGDLLALTQRSEAGTLDSADVHEHVIAAIIRLDEAITLGCVKPLHGSHAHGGSPFSDIQVEAHPSMGW
jgi:hypothetical protein